MPSNLFVFTASDRDAREHLKKTVENPIPPEQIRRHISEQEWAALSAAVPSRRFYAWGAIPGVGNTRTWSALSQGDYVLVYYEFAYHFVTRVVRKLRSRALATDLWGQNERGETWELMYFLEEPRRVHVDSKTFADVSLPARYQGFMRVATAIKPIVAKYGSIDGFVEARFLNVTVSNRAERALEVTPEALREIGAVFTASLEEAHLIATPRVVGAFLASLLTKPFVLLTGLSGSGKSQLAIRLGQWFGEDRYQVVPVRPDWTGPEAMLGYPDLLQKPESPERRPWVVTDVLRFVLKAASEPSHPYLLVLDEMNLAHVERYFADFLSGMESGEPVIPNLLPDDRGWMSADAGEARLVVPDNLFVVGTVNVDETTYMFSPKVLDRANTIEFRVATEDLAAATMTPTSVAEAEQRVLATFLSAARDATWPTSHQVPFAPELQALVLDLHRTLTEVGWGFGFRTYQGIHRYAAIAHHLSHSSLDEIVDSQVMQKVLPRLHGSRRRLEPVLIRLSRFCVDGGVSDRSPGSSSQPQDPGSAPVGQVRFPISYSKIRRMYQALLANQFASFSD